MYNLDKNTFKLSLSLVDQVSTSTEYLILYPKTMTGFFLTYTGIRGGLYICYAPSINTRGYGRTEEEAKKSLALHVEAFFKEIFILNPISRTRELRALGWTKSSFFKKKYSRAVPVGNTVLSDFDNPDLVKCSALQAA